MQSHFGLPSQHIESSIFLWFESEKGASHSLIALFICRFEPLRPNRRPGGPRPNSTTQVLSCSDALASLGMDEIWPMSSDSTEDRVGPTHCPIVNIANHGIIQGPVVFTGLLVNSLLRGLQLSLRECYDMSVMFPFPSVCKRVVYLVHCDLAAM